MFGNAALEASDTAPTFAALVAEVFTDWTGKLQHTVALAQAAGEVRRDRPASELAEFIVAVLEGAIMQSRLRKDEGPMARCLDTLRAALELRV